MKKSTLLIAFLLSLILAACGGSDGGGGGGDPAETPKKMVDPWDGIDSGNLDETVVTDQVRLLEFSDDSAIRYDGSENDGSEEICRRERREDGDGNGIFYEVCMPLEDDPYFVVLPNNAFVWHPLMLERFGTELTCYEYAEGAARGGAGDCDDILSFIGGNNDDGFDCQAGLVNGDKALVCSDDWAVVVNGDENDSKTVCRVHLSDNSGRCLGAPKQGVEDAELILPMQKTSWDGYRSNRDNNRQFGVGDAGGVLTPQDLPAGAELSYASADEGTCSVDNDASDGVFGTVMIVPGVTAPAQCRIFLKVEAKGVADRILFVDLDILKENDAAWADYIRANNYFYPGESLQAEAVTSGESASTQNVYESLDESVCTVDSQSGEVTAVAAGGCTVRLTATAVGYLDKIIEKVIPVDALKSLDERVVVTWPAFTALDDSTNVVGAAAVRLSGPVVSDSSLGIAVSHVSGDCQYAAGELSFMDTTECVLAVTVSGGRGYRDKVENFQFTPGVGTFALTWAGYGANAATYGDDALNPDAPDVAPVLSDVNYAYSADGAGCEVDAGSGALTIVAADACTVTLTATRSGYSEVEVERIVTIAGKKLILTPPPVPYGGVGSIAIDGGALAIVNPPESDEGVVTYTSGDETICTVSAGGAVEPVAAGTCSVSAYLVGSGNYADSDPVSLGEIEIIAGAVPTAGSWGSNPYGASPQVKVGASLDIVTVPGGAGEPLYESGDESICTVAEDGAVTGVAVGDCNIKFRFAGDASNASNALSEALVIGVIKGEHPALAADPYGASDSLGYGETLEFEIAPEGYGNATYSLASGSDEFCSLDVATGAITGIKIGGSCVVQVAFAGDDNYEALATTTLQAVAVEAASQTVTFREPYGEEPVLVAGGILALVNEPVAAAGEGDGGALSYSSGDTAICTVDAGTGEITGIAVGECVVKVAAAVPDDTNYAASTPINIATIEVGEGILSSLTWKPQKRGRVGVELVLMEVSVGTTGASVVYTIKDSGKSGCALKGTSGADARTLVFASWGLCQVTATASKSSYRDWVRDEYIRVRPGAISVTEGNFANGEKLKVGADDPVAPGMYSGLNPSNATASWQLVRGERDCVLVNPTTGAVRALPVAIEDVANPPRCSLRVVARKNGYETVKSSIVSIPLERGEMGAVAIQYGDGVTPVLPLGGSVDIVGTPGEANGLIVGITNIVVQGARAGICSVDNVVDSATYGRVSAEGAAIKGDQCIVTVTVSAVGYEDKDVAITLAVVTGDLTVPDGAVLSYGGSLQIGNGTAIVADASGLPAESITWKYLAEGKGGKQGVCSVDEASGALSLGDGADAGDVCLVYAVATADGYRDVILEPIEMEVDPGVLAFASAGVPEYQDELKLGADASPVIPTADDNGVAVTWGNWRVNGVCSIDEKGVVSASETAVVGDICEVYAVASASNYNPSDERKIDSLTIAAVGAFTSVTAPEYSDDLTLRGYPIGVSTAPGAAENVEITWSYKALGKRNGVASDEDICSVDAAGTVSPGTAAQAGDTCEVVATAGAPGYNDVAAPAVVLTLKDTFTSLTWASFPTEAKVGAPLDLSSNQPQVVPSDAGVAITASGDCQYSNSKVLTFSDSTECVVRVAVSKTGYANLERRYSITPAAGTITIVSLGSYTVTVGVTVDAPSISSTPVAQEVTYTLGTGSVGCTVDGGTGAVTGTAAGTCLVDVTLSKTGYNDITDTYTINVGKGSQSAPATDGNPYGANPTLAVGAPAKAVTDALAAGHGDLVYSVHTDDTAYCQVDSGTGAVTAKGTGAGEDCRIQAKYAGNANYNESSVVTIGTIGIEAGDFTAVAWTGYASSSVKFSDRKPALNTPTSTPTTTAWVYSSTTTSVCTVNSSTGALRFVMVGVCTIEAYPTATGYNDGATKSFDLTIRKGVRRVPYVTNPYGTGASVAVGSTLDIVNAPSSGPDKVLIYRSRLGSNTCSVDSSTGAVTGLPGGVGDYCYVSAKYGASTNYLETINTSLQRISIVKGTLTPDWGTYPELVVGDTVNAPTITATNANGNTVSVRKVFSQPDDSAGCTLTVGTGALQGDAVSSSCKVKVVISANGYNNAEKTYAISVGKGSQSAPTTDGNSYGANPTLAVGAPAKAVTDALAAGHGDLVYSVHTDDTAYCQVDSGTGAVTAKGTGAGEDCRIQAKYAGNTNYNESSVVTIGTIGIEAGDFTAVAWSGYASSSVKFSDRKPALNTPTSTPTTTTWVYSSTTTSVCTVNSSTGALTFVMVGVCTIEAYPTAVGYNEGATKSFDLTIRKGVRRVPYVTNPYGAGASVAVGSTLDIVNPPASGPEKVLIYRSRLGSNTCTVDSSTGAVTGLPGGVGDYCYVSAKYGASTNYLETINTSLQRISIVKGTLTPDWGTFPELVVGDTVNAPTITATNADGNTVSVRKTFSQLDDSTGCTLTVGTGALQGDAVSSSCKVKVVISANGYNNAEKTYTISVGTGTIAGAAWSGYDSSTANFGGTAPGLNDPTATTAGVTWTYASGTTSVCTVISTTGVLTMVAAGTCTIAATPSKTGYTTGAAISFDITIVQTAPDQNAGTDGAAYGSPGALYWNGEHRDITAAPSGGGGHGALEYRTAAESGGCTVDSSTGRVTTTMFATYPCEVQVRWAGNANYAPSPWVTIWQFTVLSGMRN